MAPNVNGCAERRVDEYGRPVDTMDFSSISSGKKMPFSTISTVSDNPNDFSVLTYYFCLVVPAVQASSIYFGGHMVWFPLIFTFGLIPIADTLCGTSKLNPSKELEKKLDTEVQYRLVPVVWCVAQTTILLVGMVWGVQPERTREEFIGSIFAVGLGSGMGINVAHELGHKRSSWEPLLAQYLLALTSYMHFQIEHVEGHHWNVATPLDPATGHYNESFYSFWPRTVYGSYASAWAIENNRVAKKSLPWYQNMMIWYTTIPILLVCGAGKVLGPWGAVFFVGQSVFGFTLLELVNYIEHYGLQRKEIAPGRYERVRPIHSWNSDQRVTNNLLFKLQRHSDHHAFPCRRYQILRSFDESPQLPSGYATCILIAAVPSLWFRIMNPKVEEFNKWVEESRKDMEARGIKIE
eukprot:Clim_evm14s215 gene=Clim_evmTU14s215